MNMLILEQMKEEPYRIEQIATRSKKFVTKQILLCGKHFVTIMSINCCKSKFQFIYIYIYSWGNQSSKGLPPNWWY